MTDLTAHARLFASPCHGDAVGLVRKLAAGRLQGTRKRVIHALTAVGQDAAATALAAFGTGPGSAWRPETGLALLAHRAGSNALAALQLGAACAGMDGAGALTVTVAPAQWLFLDGWLMAVEGTCSLTSSRGEITIRSDQGTTSFIRAGNRWIQGQVASHAWRAHASGGLAPRYITVSGLRHVVEGFPWISDRPPSPPVDVSGVEERIARIHRGWAVILERAPRFGTWVASTAAGCLLLEPSGKHDAQSGSSYDHPGLIAFEPPDSAEFCGEILVHECAHQHMLAYTMVTPLVDPASQETYYSPIKRAHRTLDRVLSGAHAVGNMILYYDDLRQGGPLSQSSQKRFERHVRWFNDDYRLALDHSTSLTEAGRILWGSLCESVDLAVGR